MGWTSLVYILAGSVRCGDTEVAAHHTAVLSRCRQQEGKIFV